MKFDDIDYERYEEYLEEHLRDSYLDSINHQDYLPEDEVSIFSPIDDERNGIYNIH